VRQVRDRQPDAWVRFTRIYGPLVYEWSRKAGLQDSDAADLMQEVLCSVNAGIDGFRGEQSGGSLRGWLWVITRNQLNRYFQRRKRTPDAVGGSTAQQQLNQQPDFLESDKEPSNEHSLSRLTHRALSEIQNEFEDKTWQAFWRLSVAQLPAKDIAKDLEITPGAVRQAKYRVLCRLRDMLASE